MRYPIHPLKGYIGGDIGFRVKGTSFPHSLLANSMFSLVRA